MYFCTDMSVLENFVPKIALPFLEKWFRDHICHLKITPNRQSKLGDYRLLPDGSHQISVNGTLDPELFFFVLTHELAHLISFHEKRKILPHGKEWKSTFRNMLLDSILVYSNELQPIIRDFSKSPKANFMSSPDLVKYFDKKRNTSQTYVEDLEVGSCFVYLKHHYRIEERKKKRYLCKNLHTGRSYLFKSCARVEKCEQHD